MSQAQQSRFGPSVNRAVAEPLMEEIAPLCAFAKASSAKIKENEECPLFWRLKYSAEGP